jgi:hypothetical protein
MNDAIRALAEQKGAILVDVEARFRDASDHRIPGGSLLLEHVHPNADGYFLLAAAFYDALMETGLLGEASVSWSEEQARLDMPITQVDRILAAYDVAEL